MPTSESQKKALLKYYYKTKDEQSEYHKEYYLINRERINEHKKKKYDKDTARELQRRYRWKNKPENYLMLCLI